jgi:hypothetical protein
MAQTQMARHESGAMIDFLRFPHTPHLAWLGESVPRDDKVLPAAQATALLVGEVVVEEKLDGANLGFSLGPQGLLRVQNRGQYLAGPHVGQFARLPSWLAQHGDAILDTLTPELMLFGEWCAARHSLDYSFLPDLFLLFDVYDRVAGRFWSTLRRNGLAQTAGLAIVPKILQGRTTLSAIQQAMMITPSCYRAGQSLEGLVVRRESAHWCEARAKLVRPDFTQGIDAHWHKRAIEWNRVNQTTEIAPESR